MKIKRNIIVLSLFAIMVSSCIDKILGHQYVATIENCEVGFKQSFSIDGLFDHFPKSISNKLFIDLQSRVPSNIYYPDSYHTGFVYLMLHMGKDSLSLSPKKYIYKTHYTGRNFIIDDGFSYYTYFDTLKLRNVALPQTYPIPYFEDLDFGLGSERIDLRSIGIHLVIDKNNVPDDLEVFVLKSNHGYFWKLKADWDRPETLKEWKNGYSCGIAISRKCNMIVYWMKAW
jgi:hypothetical protein